MRQWLLLSLVIVILSKINLIAQDCQLNPPTDLHFSDITSCSATLHWKSTAAVTKYLVSYKISTTAQWMPNTNVGTNTHYQFTGLLPGTKYQFSVKSKCADGSVSPKMKKAGTTKPCSLPEMVFIEGISSHAAKITVEASCDNIYDSLFVMYQTLNGAPQTVSFEIAEAYVVEGLNYDSTYLFSISICPLALNTWTDVDTLHLQRPPNIIFIIVDDSRYDYFSCNGAPPFFQTPNIDRIANEGVNFKKSFVVTSLCQPSRASIATGLFPLRTGVTENGIPLDSGFITIPKVLNDYGYYTALLGKNHEIFLQGAEPEFDFYMVFSQYPKYNGKKFDYNGEIKLIDKDYILTLTDTAMRLLQDVNDPLFIWLAYVVPHIPHMPLPSFDGKYDNYVIPWKADTARYTVNYPSCTYIGPEFFGEELDTTYRNVLEEMAGLDSCIGEILKVLENTGKLDNTLLIFTSDNGYMLGSHHLDGKTRAYEPSMRIPLFIRYPEWFSPLSIVNDQFALNLDLTPTIYEAAQVEYDGPLDGISLKKIYDGDASRKQFYYLMLHNPNSITPVKRAIRDQYYKYVHHNCSSDTVEELFDMQNDSLELTNLINNHNYDAVASAYRLKYDSMRIAWNDTAESTLKNCYIANPSVLKQLIEDTETNPLSPLIYPTLTNGSIEVFIPWLSAKARLYDQFGKLQIEWLITENYTQTNLSQFSSGIYMLNLSDGVESITQKLVLTR